MRIFEAVLQACADWQRRDEILSARLRSAGAGEPGRGAGLLARARRVAPVRRRHRPDGAARGGEARRTASYVSLWGSRSSAASTSSDARSSLGALTTYAECSRIRVLRAEFPLLCRAAAARPAASRRRTAARSAATSRTRRRPPTRRRRCSSTTRSSSCLDARGSGACRTRDSTPATRRWTWRPTSSSCAFGCREGAADVDRRPIARSARAARRRSRRSALRPRRDLDGRRHSRRPARFRQRGADRRPLPHAESALRGRPLDDERDRRGRAGALAHDIAPIDDMRSTASTAARRAESADTVCVGDARYGGTH